MSETTKNPAALKGKFLSPPSLLTHYTNLRGMMGIIESKQIWETHVSFLNDSRELQQGLDAAAKVIRKFSFSKNFPDWQARLNSVVAKMREGEIPNTYAACFCQKSDLLSQWRGYGGSEQGVSITFDRVKLAAAIKPFKANLSPIVYGKLKTADQITKDLSERLYDLDRD